MAMWIDSEGANPFRPDNLTNKSEVFLWNPDGPAQRQCHTRASDSVHRLTAREAAERLLDLIVLQLLQKSGELQLHHS